MGCGFYKSSHSSGKIEMFTGIIFILMVFEPQDEGGIKAYIWGEVEKPGAYRLFGTPDILELISVAGGPTQRADLKKVILIKAKDGKKRKINIDRIMKEGKIIFLTSGDVVVVQPRMFYLLREYLSVVSSIAILLNLAITLSRL